MTPYFDSHCHLNDEALVSDLKAVIQSAKKEGVAEILCVGWDYSSSRQAVEIAERFPGVYAAIGVHPENHENETPETIEKLRELAKHHKVVAIGEIGLDYYWKNDPETKTAQKEWFVKQIDLANSLGLPVTIHGREASQDLFDIISAHPIENGFVLHCYSGSPEMMARFAKLGAYFGFDGPVTFKNAVNPKECLKACPADRLLFETDAPYMAPVPYRGKRNGPQYIPEIVTKGAEIRQEPLDQLKAQTLKNFHSLFKRIGGEEVKPQRSSWSKERRTLIFFPRLSKRISLPRMDLPFPKKRWII